MAGRNKVDVPRIRFSQAVNPEKPGIEYISGASLANEVD